ncbi:MAG: SH3 domain-containing protein [Eubacteriales bacterium]|nr:SH3 domain-containing protein [Eubacteriales bacterium]
MDNFREWLSDNLRYLAVGLIAIVIVIILFFGGKAIFGKKGTTPAKQETSSSVTASASKSASQAINLGDNVKVNADEEITSLMKSYFAALQAGDEKSLAKYVTVVDSSLFKDYIESYQVSQIYTLPGENADSKVVFTTVDVKYKNIETHAPALKQFYISKNNNGNYIIQSSVLSDAAKELVQTAAKDQGIVNLTNDVNTKFNAAVSSDAKLKELYDLINSIASGSESKTASATNSANETAAKTTETTTSKKTESTTSKKTEATASKKTEQTENGNQTVTINPTQSTPTTAEETGNTKVAITDLNIVRDPSTQEVVGEVASGQSVVVLSVDELGWAHVTVDGVEGYVADYLLQAAE